MGQAWVLTFFIHDVNLVNLISFIYIFFFIFQTASAWGAKRSKLPGFQMREIVRWLSRKGSLDWWKRLTNWAFCVIVKSRWLSSIHTINYSNMHQPTWIKCCLNTQVICLTWILCKDLRKCSSEFWNMNFMIFFVSECINLMDLVPGYYRKYHSKLGYKSTICKEQAWKSFSELWSR